MSREIMFRAWHEGKNMIYRELTDRNWYTEDDKQICGAVPEDKHWFKIMQYTGLNDRHGVGIYEGDIVKFKEYATERIKTVEYDKNHCAFYPLAGYGHTEPEFLSDFEVVGNIYENPELMEAK